MTIQRPPYSYPTPLEPLRVVRNGRAPLASTGGRILSSLNHAITYRRKTIFSKSLHLDSIPAGVAGTVTPWRTYCRTGHAAAGELELWFETIAAPADTAGAEPSLTWKASGGLEATPFAQGVNTGTIGPTDLVRGYSKIDVSANTVYEIELDASDYARPVAATIWEVHGRSFESGDTGISQRDLIAPGQPITDEQANQMQQNAHDIWLCNAAPVFAWCTDEDPDNGGTAPQRSTASFANMFDQTVTTIDANSRGFYPTVQYHNPAHSDNVPCVLAVCASNASSAGGDVRLLDPDGTLGTVSSFGTSAEWKTTTVNLDGSKYRHKLDLHLQGDGSNTLTVYAAALYEYTT